jgi:menaquinone-dependent protoporphyrinogen oxidase
MKSSIIAASRYGSTHEGARWIAERLELAGWSTVVYPAATAPAPSDEELVLLGSGLYSHRVLPELESYIDQHLEALSERRLGLFVLAMRTTPVFVRGEAHGGLGQLVPYFKKLQPALIHADMLPGQMVYSRLSPEDARGLDRFYEMLNLPAEEIQKRKAPRTLMCKSDYWAFAETLLAKSREKS